MPSQLIKNKHLLCRAGFGLQTDQINALQNINEKELYRNLEKFSTDKPAPLKIKNIISPVRQQQRSQNMSANDKRMLLLKNLSGIKNLNLSWLDEMTYSPAQLREKMAFFWHGHFACRSLNFLHQQMLIEIIRNNTLGNFGDLLRSVSKSAAMLKFLNNQQNRKQKPNENFAREVMELFTMGRGNYTEQDVKEAARAFTGWGFGFNGEFIFRNSFHDNDNKTFLRRTGNFTGDDILDILLEQKTTALFITKKIYSFFVNETIDEDKANVLAKDFYESNYDIAFLMRKIFASDWFYDEKNIGSKIKSPVELMVGIRRMLPVDLHYPEVQIILQRTLGQVLFYPPNVAGWSGGKNWIDSSTLMTRLRIPQMLEQYSGYNITPKTDDDIQMGMDNKESILAYLKQNKKAAGFANVNWQKFSAQFDKVAENDLYDALYKILLQVPPGSVNTNIQEGMSREEFISSGVISLMSTPEYQLC